MNKHKAHQSMAHKQKYEQQKIRTARNKKRNIQAQAKFQKKKQEERDTRKEKKQHDDNGNVR